MAASIPAVVSGCKLERPPNKVLKFAPGLRRTRKQRAPLSAQMGSHKWGQV